MQALHVVVTTNAGRRGSVPRFLQGKLHSLAVIPVLASGLARDDKPGLLLTPHQMPEVAQDHIVDAALERHDQVENCADRRPPPGDELDLVAGPA